MTKPNRAVRKFLQKYSPRKEVEGTKDDKNIACLLVVSSTSGFGNAAKLAPQVAEHLSKSFSRVVVVPTQHQGHCREILAQEPITEYSVAVILGGDGAFSEATHGMLGRKDGVTVPLAHCPGGSGCAIAGNTAGFWKGKDVIKACDVIAQLKTRPMDVIQVECADGKTRYCTSCIAGGINTDTIALADKYRWTYSVFGPTFRYIIGLFAAYWKYGPTDNGRRMQYTIRTCDDKEESFELPTFGLALYNSGRVTVDSAFATSTPFSGDLSLSISKTYAGFGNQLKYVGALKNVNGEMDTTNDQYKEYEDIHFDRKVTEVKCEPVDEINKKRPCLLAFDGEPGAYNKDYMAAPFTARVLPGKITVIVA